ncbi:MAG: FecR domain-containing protein [Pseudomonadota bacterium]
MSADPGSRISETLQAAHDWRLLLDSAEASERDRDQFQSWLAEDPSHEQVYNEAIRFWSALGTITTDALDQSFLQPTKRERWTAFTDRLSGGLRVSTATINATGTFALLCIVSAVYLFGFDRPPHPEITSGPIVANVSTRVGQTESVMLSDGSLVTLGAASTIQTSISSDERVVRLIDGTAFFEVSSDPDRPFVVKADQLMATVLGTTFDVRIAGDVTSVAVAEGSVEVTHPLIVADQATSVVSRHLLSMGQQVMTDARTGLQEIESIDLSDIGAWRRNRLIYNGSSLEELVADANRYSDKPIEIAVNANGIEYLRIRGAFDAEDVDGMLSILEEIHPVSIDRNDPTKVVIRPQHQ